MVTSNMLKRVAQLSLMLFAVTSIASAGLETQISYEVEGIGANRWQYTYDVSNTSLAEGISAFTIWFDLNKYEDLTITSPAELASDWDQLVLQPDPQLLDDGLFDVLAIGDSIDVGQSVPGFSVSFDWMGQGEPDTQFYEVINPDTYEVTANGFTVPEPTSMLIFGLASFLARARRKRGCGN